MTSAPTFVGSIPENYDRYIAKLILEPFAKDLVARVPTRGLASVLELACGTGLVTEKLRKVLADGTRLVATDFSPDMVDIARGKPGLQEGVEFKVADATDLPFSDNSFDMVVAHFGFMFFPDKARAACEILRVLNPGGRLLFYVWDRIENNDLPRLGHETIEALFSGNPPAFYKIPFSYYDQLEIRNMLRSAGFVDIAVTEVQKQLVGKAKDFAIGLVQGNPIVTELREQLGADIDEVTAKVQNVLAAKLAGHPEGVKGSANAIVVGGRKPKTAAESTPAPVASAKKATQRARAKPAPRAKKAAVPNRAKPRTAPAK